MKSMRKLTANSFPLFLNIDEKGYGLVNSLQPLAGC
jgi:tartrate dehydratase beta subunit/fumarate hydratase class I family protein